MADRKQTPDVLGEILGAEPTAPQGVPSSRPRTPPRRRASAREPGQRTKAQPPRWEYMEVVFRNYGGYRPRFVNGVEQKGWKQSPVIHDYLNQLGEEGWELVGLGGRHRDQIPAYLKRRKG